MLVRSMLQVKVYIYQPHFFENGQKIKIPVFGQDNLYRKYMIAVAFTLTEFLSIMGPYSI